MLHTERQTLKRQMLERTNHALEVISLGLASAEHLSQAIYPINHNPLSKWGIPLNQLSQQNHLTILVTDLSTQKVLYRSPPITENNQQQSPYQWVNFLIAIKPLRTDKTLPQSAPVNVTIYAEPGPDLLIINKKIVSFLVLMALLGILVYSIIKIITSRFQRELNGINKAIKQIKRGHYNLQLPDLYFVELNEISDSYNQSIDQLEKIRRENQTLAERLLWLQEEERQYLAQELHDELGQSISAIKVMCVSMQKSAQNGTAPTNQQNNQALAKRYQSITDICDHLYTVVRDLMKQLRPTVLDELGLKAALEEIVENWQQRQLTMDISLSCSESIEQCSDSIKINIYRIVQESLTNIMKHADAQHIQIKLCEYQSQSRPWTANNYYQLTIIDDGTGFNTANKRFGFGIVGMRERVKSMGGTLEIDSNPGAGTTISVQVPG